MADAPDLEAVKQVQQDEPIPPWRWVGWANWTPAGLVGGGVFAVTAKHAPPPPGVLPPPLWGTEERLHELLGDRISELRLEKRHQNFRFPSPEWWLDFFRTYFGPLKVAFERVGEDGAEALENDLLEVMRSHNRAGDRALVAPAEYVEVVAVRA